MSLSVLIPVYNRDVTLLVSSLASLLTKEKIVSEIILLDDASESDYVSINQKLAEGDFIFHYRNSSNLGRVRTRNLLAEKARYDHLLFLDSDVKIIRPDFISKYYEQVKAKVDVCCGGLVYSDHAPDDIKYKLHWKYGAQREVKRINAKGFLSSNFLIKKILFTDLNPVLQLNKYGHEDTIWGIELAKKGVEIEKIDNPVLHKGLEETSVFINKSLQAVENLVLLENHVGQNSLEQNIKLYNWYIKFRKYHLLNIIEKGEKLFHGFVIRNLRSYNPSLNYFDWMRLAYLIRLKRNQAKTSL